MAVFKLLLDTMPDDLKKFKEENPTIFFVMFGTLGLPIIVYAFGIFIYYEIQITYQKIRCQYYTWMLIHEEKKIFKEMIRKNYS